MQNKPWVAAIVAVRTVSRLLLGGKNRICSGVLPWILCMLSSGELNAIQIEEAQRALQERFQAVNGPTKQLHWNSKPLDQRFGAKLHPDYPEDGYWETFSGGSEDIYPILVDMLGSFVGSTMSAYLLNGNVEGLPDLPPNFNPDKEGLFWITKPSTHIGNYRDRFSQLQEIICKLKHYAQGNSYWTDRALRAVVVGGYSDEGWSCSKAIQQWITKWNSATWDEGLDSGVPHYTSDPFFVDDDDIAINISMYARTGRAKLQVTRTGFGSAQIYVRAEFVSSTGVDGLIPLKPAGTRFLPVPLDNRFHAFESRFNDRNHTTAYIGNATDISDIDCGVNWQVFHRAVIVTPCFKHNIKTCKTDCSSCSSCTFGSDSSGVGSVDFKVELGLTHFGESAGTLKLVRKIPDVYLSKPSALQIEAHRDTKIVYGIDGAIRQVRSSEGLADVVTVNDFKYDLRFYHGSVVGNTNASGLYQVSGTPFKAITIENPAASANNLNTLRVTKKTGLISQTNDYIWTPLLQRWELVTGSGVRKESRSSTPGANANERIETSIIRDASDSVVYNGCS